MNTNGGVDVLIHVLLPLALIGGDGQLYPPATLFPGRELPVPIG
jgi:hypothetical protein